jgi:hypothetical protein
MKILDQFKKTRAYLKNIAPTLLVGAFLSSGNADAATGTRVYQLGNFPSGTNLVPNAAVPKEPVGTLPPGSILKSVSWNVTCSSGDPYMGDFCLLFRDRLSAGALQVGAYAIAGHSTDGELNFAPTKLSWKAGDNYGVGTTASVTLTATDGVPAIDLYDHSTEYSTTYSGGWAGTITLGYDITIHTAILDTPAPSQAYASGSSIMASANVAEPDDSLTNTVTFEMTPISPSGSPVSIVSTDTNSPFTADFGSLPAGTYTMKATAVNNGSPAGTATSATNTFTVQSASPTTTSLSSATNPSTYGQSVTFTATVAPIPTGGTVQFYDAGSPLGTAVAVNTGTGLASLTVSSLGAVSHSISAEYSGYAIYLGSTSDSVSQVVDKAPLTVKALNTLRSPNTANPVPLPYQITGYKLGQSLATSGVTGAPVLTTTATTSSPVGGYPIAAALGDLAASNYSFTLVDGTLTVATTANTFSVNFYAYPGNFTTDEQRDNIRVPSGVPAGKSDWFASGWLNVAVPFGMDSPLPAVTLTSNQGSSAVFRFNDCRNGWIYGNEARTTLLGDGNGNMMDGHVNGTLHLPEGAATNKFEMEMTGIPFSTYDVIFYMGGNLPQFGDGTGIIEFNGTQRGFTVKPGAFGGTFTEMVDAATPGNYIVFTGVTGTSFTTKAWGNGFNHLGPYGFQIRESTVVAGYASWASTNTAGASLADDHDNDGVSNGVEYFIGGTTGNTTGFTALPGVAKAIDGALSVTWAKGSGYLGVYGTNYVVETSATLTGVWTVETLGGGNITDSSASLKFTFPGGVPYSGKNFARLKVTGP